MDNDKDFLKNNEQTDNETNRTANNHVEDPSQQLGDDLSTQGDVAELKENLGGTTNLSLDQLKEDDGEPDEEG